MENPPESSEDVVGVPGGQRDDELFEVLSAARRRAVLEYLRDAETPVSFEELTTELVHREEQPDWPVGQREKWDDVRVALAHAHLPVMDREDLVDYDEREETVAAGERAGAAWAQLDALRDDR